jgi:hypothetical protein
MRYWVKPLTLFLALLAATLAAVASAESGPAGAAPDSGRGGAASPAPLAAVQSLSPTATTQQVSCDTQEDIEPVVVTVSRQGMPYTLTAYVKFAGNVPRINYAGTSDFVSFQRGPLKIPTKYDRAGCGRKLPRGWMSVSRPALHAAFESGRPGAQVPAFVEDLAGAADLHFSHLHCKPCDGRYSLTNTLP